MIETLQSIPAIAEALFKFVAGNYGGVAVSFMLAIYMGLRVRECESHRAGDQVRITNLSAVVIQLHGALAQATGTHIIGIEQLAALLQPGSTAQAVKYGPWNGSDRRTSANDKRQGEPDARTRTSDPG